MKRTFKYWSERGYSIKRGSKSVGKNKDGEYLFSDEQVTSLEKLESKSSWDSADDLNTCGGPDYGIYGNCD